MGDRADLERLRQGAQRQESVLCRRLCRLYRQGQMGWLCDQELRRPERQVHRGLVPGVSEHRRSEEHTSELQSLMRISYAVFCLKKKKQVNQTNTHTPPPQIYQRN